MIFRMIRLDDVLNSFAIKDPRAVKGYYIEADTEEQAEKIMQKRFPDDNEGFEATDQIDPYLGPTRDCDDVPHKKHKKVA